MKDERDDCDMSAEQLEEVEDAAHLRAIMQRIAEGKERTYSHEEVWANLDEEATPE